MRVVRTDHEVHDHPGHRHIKPDWIGKFNHFSMLFTLICIAVVIREKNGKQGYRGKNDVCNQ